MLGWFRILQRSGGLLAASLVLLGVAFYGIAQFSIIFADDPSRGLRILGVFVALSAAFCVLLVWLVRRAVNQILRPILSARELTSRISGLGEAGGRAAYHALSQNSRHLGGFARKAVRATFRAVGATFHFSLQHRPFVRRSENQTAGASVIPFRKFSRAAGDDSRKKDHG